MAGPPVRIAPELDNAPRAPEQTLLHRVVHEQLEIFLASARSEDAAVPRFVEQELRAFLRKTPWRDGTTHIVMERRELLERLVPLIPPPRANQVRYHGILAPGASLRDRVTPGGGPAKESASQPTTGSPATSERASVAAGEGLPRESPPAGPSPIGVGNDPKRGAQAVDRSLGTNPSGPDTRDHGRSPRLRWAALLQRVFGIDALRCPRCGSAMRVLAAIENPVVARKILACLGLPARAPPLARAPGEPRDLGPACTPRETPAEDDWDFDQTPIEDEP